MSGETNGNSSVDRVRANTALEINRRLDAEAAERVRFYTSQSKSEILAAHRGTGTGVGLRAHFGGGSR